jgi:hypothetical protein
VASSTDINLSLLTAPQLVELSEECFWRCLALAGDTDACATLRAVERESERRGSAPVFREAVGHVSTLVTRHRERIDRSPGFRSAARMQQLLRIIVDHTLRGESVKRAVLALAMYGPGAAEKKAEGALSTEVRRLRETLEEYYQGPGLGDSLRVRIPQGRRGYRALITRTSAAGRPVLTAPSAIPVVPLNALRGFSAFPAFSPTAGRLQLRSIRPVAGRGRTAADYVKSWRLGHQPCLVSRWPGHRIPSDLIRAQRNSGRTRDSTRQ